MLDQSGLSVFVGLFLLQKKYQSNKKKSNKNFFDEIAVKSGFAASFMRGFRPCRRFWEICWCGFRLRKVISRGIDYFL
jgi:hypothetical protein